jgi:hypothetical protein
MYLLIVPLKAIGIPAFLILIYHGDFILGAI